MTHLTQQISVLVGCLGLAMTACTHPAANPIESAAQSETTAANQLLQLGLDFSSQNDSLRAEQYLAAAIDEGADVDVALPPLLRACVDSGRFQAAAKYAEDNLGRVRARRETEMTLAGLLLALDKQPQALSHLQYVTRRYPDYAMGHFLLGRVLLEYSQDVERADVHFHKYMELDPSGKYFDEAQDSRLKAVSEAPLLPVIPQPETSDVVSVVDEKFEDTPLTSQENEL